MRIETRKVYDVVVVDVEGRLDSQTAGTASDRLSAIAQGPDGKVVLNLAKLDYVSSAGLRSILLAAKLLRAHGGELRLCAATPAVRMILETSGFNDLLVQHDDEKDAVTAFAAR